MKKLILLLFVTIITSCGGDDDTTVTTDPLIGVWTLTYTEFDFTFTDSYKINSNGTYIYTVYEDGVLTNFTETGNWSNKGSFIWTEWDGAEDSSFLGTDLSSRNQRYKLINDDGSDDGDDPKEPTWTARFSSDFNSFETEPMYQNFYEEEVYVRK